MRDSQDRASRKVFSNRLLEKSILKIILLVEIPVLSCPYRDQLRQSLHLRPILK
jgi:hypothetical protein